MWKKQFKVWNISPRTFLAEVTDWVTDSYNISFSSKSKITLWFDVGFWHPSQRLPSVLWTVSLEFTLLSGLQQTLWWAKLKRKVFTAVILLKRSPFALQRLQTCRLPFWEKLSIGILKSNFCLFTYVETNFQPVDSSHVTFCIWHEIVSRLRRQYSPGRFGFL